MVSNSDDDILIWGSLSNSTTKPTESIEFNDSNISEVSDEIEITLSEEENTDAVEFVELNEDSSYIEDDLNEDSNSNVYEKKYYKISEVETIIGETQSTIRFWEESFAELGKNFCSQRSRGGTRKFTKENIDNLKLLKMLLRERRLTIEGAISEIKGERRRNAKERALILLNETKDELNSLIDAYNCILHQNC